MSLAERRAMSRVMEKLKEGSNRVISVEGGAKEESSDGGASRAPRRASGNRTCPGIFLGDTRWDLA